MPEYWRHRVPGGTYFFTVNLLDRRSDLLVTHIGLLRASVSRVRHLMPFHIDAWVMLPDHMHALWTLPDGGRELLRPLAGAYSTFHRAVAEGRYPSSWSADGIDDSDKGERSC